MISVTHDEEPSIKKLKLSVDLELITYNWKKLTGLKINYAQKVLKLQFPGASLDSTAVKD